MGERCTNRVEDMLKGKLCAPMPVCWRVDIPDCLPPYGQFEAVQLFNALAALDPRLEFIFDRPTGTWLVYQIVKRGALPPDDELKLVCPVQIDMDAPWPEGQPCAPSIHVIEYLKRTDMTKGGAIDPEKARELAGIKSDKQTEELRFKRDNESTPDLDAIDADLKATANKKRVASATSGKGNAYVSDRPKAKKLIVAV